MSYTESTSEQQATDAIPPKQVSFDVPSTYQLISVIGEGGYGVVCSAYKSDTNEQVAIKKVPAFLNPIFCLRTLREIKILQHFRHENIISLIDLPRPKFGLNDIYIVQELMDTDLGKVIKSQNLTEDHMQYFILPFSPGVKFEDLYPNASPMAIDLLSKLLAFNPKKRITVDEALNHPFIAVYHDSSDEPTFPAFPPEFFDFEKSMMFFNDDKEEIQNLIKKYGGRVTTSLSKNTDCMVMGQDAGPAKIQKAKTLRLKVIDEQGFIDFLGKLPASGGSGRAAELARAKRKREEAE
ncbi:hypothetical protein FF38_01472, partial [Lucilia cuprina]